MHPFFLNYTRQFAKLCILWLVLIAAGTDILTISRRLGHGSPAITLGVYGHLFSNTDAAAADVIEAAMGTRGER